MRVSKDLLCKSCLNIHPMMDSGNPSEKSIEDLLDGKVYKDINNFGYIMVNEAILLYLQNNEGCQNCISLFERATGKTQ